MCNSYHVPLLAATYRKNGPLLPSVQTCKGSPLSRREIEKESEGVKHAINCPDSQLQPKGRGKSEYMYSRGMSPDRNVRR